MVREQRRKEQKKKKNLTKEKQEQLDTSIKGSTIIILTIVVILIIIALYFISAIFITKEINISSSDNKTSEENSEEDNTNNPSSVSNKILASNIFNQKEDTYYVYFYDFSDEDENVKTIIDSKSDLTIYRVDTESSLNQKYVTKDSGNKNVDKIDNLKVKNPTVLKISNDKVVAYYEGGKSIIDNLSK